MKAMRPYARTLTGLLCLLPLVWSCGEQPAPRKDAVVTRPIQSPPATSPAAPGSVAPAPEVPSDLPQAAPPTPTASAEPGRTAYNPLGKLDPFQPLFKEAPPAAQDKALEKPKEPERPRTPLEKIDLAQLTLKAVVFAEGGNRALVEEATGKGFIIRLGTSIGWNRGTVVDIQKEAVIIEEAVENAFGEKVVQKRELKLQKPPGE
jgi:type IV pilus assembly protein PilP